MGRRRAKNAQRFFYDGYLQVADDTGNSYTWDCTEAVAIRPLAWLRADSVAYYTHNGNKNVSEVVDIDDIIAAHYSYAPFGAVVTQLGTSSTANPWRFSSEYAEDDIATVYYNYRPYEPKMGRWMSRDFVEEYGDIGLLLHCHNDPLGNVDVLGLKCKIVIYGGHATSAQQYMAGLSKNGTGPKDCGDLIGFVSCFRDLINSDADDRFPGHVIPGIPRDPGSLHNDNKPNPKGDELASVGLSSRLCKNVSL